MENSVQEKKSEIDQGSKYEVNDAVEDEEEEELRILRKNTPLITVEPMGFLVIVGVGALLVNLQSYILEAVTLNMTPFLNCSSPDCRNESDKTQYESIQSVAATYLMIRNVLETGIQIVYAIFLGGWIEKQGCKATMLLPIFGFMISALVLVFISLSNFSHPAVILLASVPIGLSGGIFALAISVNTYLTRVSTEKARSLRMAFIEGTVVLATPIGLYAGSQIHKWGGYTAVFIFCTILQAFGFLFCAFVGNDKKKMLPSCSSLKLIFNLNGIKSTKEVFTHPPPGTKTLWIILLYVIMAFRYLSGTGMHANLFLYTNLKFGWSPYEYSNFFTADGLIQVAGITIFSLVGMKLLQMRDANLGIICGMSYLTGTLIWAFPTAGWMMYFGSAVQLFAGGGSILCRSIISKHVLPQHAGKAFVLVGVTDSVVILIAAPLFGYIYSNTVNSAPNTIFLVSISTSVGIILSFAYLSLVMPKVDKEDDGKVTTVATADEPNIKNEQFDGKSNMEIESGG